MAAVSEGRHPADAGVQTAAHASSCRPHSAALRPHVLCEKAFSGLPQEDRLAAGAVPRLPHTVGLLKVQSLSCICTKMGDFMVLPYRKHYLKMRQSVLQFRSLVHIYITQKQYIKVGGRSVSMCLSVSGVEWRLSVVSCSQMKLEAQRKAEHEKRQREMVRLEFWNLKNDPDFVEELKPTMTPAGAVQEGGGECHTPGHPCRAGGITAGSRRYV